MGLSTRREFLRKVAAGAIVSIGGFGCSGSEAAGKDVPGGGKGRKLNVLFIAVDDLRPQLGCYGQREIISPNIDRLASEGLLFERTYCQQAVCAPSRASILSGCRPDTTRIYDLNTPLRKAMPDVLSLPQHFRENGYETLSIGKIYHHPSDDARGWSVKPYRAGTFPEGKWVGRGYLTQEAAQAVREYERKNPGSQGRGPAFEAADVPDNYYPDGANVDHAIEELRRLKDKPFFMAMGFYKPHLPFNAPKKYWDMYDRSRIRLADNPFAPKEVTPYSLTDFGELRSYTNIPAKGPVGDDLARELIHGYCACVSYTDSQTGRLLDELDRLGIRDHTVIILWGDHGWKLGEHGSWCKHTNFELDTHVPMIISAPGRKNRGGRTAALTEFVDIYPSLCEVCSLDVPKHCEGTSFVGLMDDPNRRWKKAAFSQYPRGKVMGYSMRTQRYRYTEWQERSGGGIVASELYDHATDDAENKNIAARDDMKEVVAELSGMLREGWKAALP